MSDLKDERAEGKWAWRDHGENAVNPYPAGSPAAWAWGVGYTCAQDLDEQDRRIALLNAAATPGR